METKTCPYCAEEIKAEAIRCRYCHAWLSRPPSWAEEAFRETWSAFGRWKGRSSRLRRPVAGRMIAGVCAGIADYLGIDPTLVRVIYAVTTFLTLGAPGVFLYVVLALVIPSESDAGFV